MFTKSNDPANVAEEGICFEEFLEMMSVFSEHAPRDLKVFYAFKIYGKRSILLEYAHKRKRPPAVGSRQASSRSTYKDP